MTPEYKKAAELAVMVEDFLRKQNPDYVSHQAALVFCIIDMAYSMGITQEDLKYAFGVTVDNEYELLKPRSSLPIMGSSNSLLN